MFFKFFNHWINIVISFYIIVTGTIFAYSIFNLPLIDVFMIGFIFFAGPLISILLKKYYGNAVISFNIQMEDIELIKMNKTCYKFKKDSCNQIVFKPNAVIMEFDHNKKFYIHRHYLFNKSLFDFSEFNKENFRHAEIIK